MKKLKLNLDQMKDAELLTRSQLKTIMGGDPEEGSGTCSSSANCYKTILQGNEWVTVPNGSISCSGTTCTHSSNSVSCDGDYVTC